METSLHILGLLVVCRTSSVRTVLQTPFRESETHKIHATKFGPKHELGGHLHSQ